MCVLNVVFCYFSGCDNCEEWYHGDCIGITEKDAKYIEQYYCVVSVFCGKP